MFCRIPMFISAVCRVTRVIIVIMAMLASPQTANLTLFLQNYTAVAQFEST